MNDKEIIKTLLCVIGNNLELDVAIRDVVLGLLDLQEDKKPDPKKKVKVGKNTKPRNTKTKPFDTGKLKALLDGGWPVSKIADEMGVSVQTIYNKMKTEGLTK